ncbi:MAG: prolipoprotein diacylglyceryl transferase [Candidatus Omnitrophica bacterium CG1_02_44_16]|nr:MAG: prolipoprotein diacylglyceryl transferase [Candidatus Omnitrophica bacterium CG1_02_44_16]PIY83678.1 MAG: prolipoprotein diacylglyceryl transferase [Candidatus Omnitrophica bacterium CG_4_10_14_0_8_um_filter_44_12]PIZ84424.1 MAG: prolipoprotein diacylglyceryl transferase [Candidatus Omnitrophica bacterium CG_4_10_14_0_2_um_filter_44_9]
MLPILFKCPFFTVYSYGVFVALAFLVSSFLLMKEARQRKLNENTIYDLCIFLLISGIISARLFYVFLNWGEFRANLFEIAMLQHGGLVWFGGLIGAVVFGVVFIRSKKMPLFSTLDLFAPYIILGQAIGRIGCFFNGCCYGMESKWGIYFPVHHATLFPSQLLDCLTLLIVFLILRSVRVAREGLIFSYYIMLASLQRFLMEYARNDVRPFYFNLSIFQWISMGLFLCGLVLYLILSLRGPKPLGHSAINEYRGGSICRKKAA